jgi:RNA recognition motif-containing protein
MAKNIYVGNLVWSATEEDLRQHFEPFGAVLKAQVIQDRDTGRSRGFGFVEMANDDEAQKAIEALHDFEYQSRPLTVNVAQPREERAPGGPRGSGSGSFSRGARNLGGTDRGRRY